VLSNTQKKTMQYFTIPLKIFELKGFIIFNGVMWHNVPVRNLLATLRTSFYSTEIKPDIYIYIYIYIYMRWVVYYEVYNV
jgi:hypothetical protein